MTYDEHLQIGNPVDQPTYIDYETLYFNLVNDIKEIHYFVIDCKEQSNNGFISIIDKKLDRLNLPC